VLERWGKARRERIGGIFISGRQTDRAGTGKLNELADVVGCLGLGNRVAGHLSAICVCSGAFCRETFTMWAFRVWVWPSQEEFLGGCHALHKLRSGVLRSWLEQTRPIAGSVFHSASPNSYRNTNGNPKGLPLQSDRGFHCKVIVVFTAK
jgi:hypothetical protein